MATRNTHLRALSLFLCLLISACGGSSGGSGGSGGGGSSTPTEFLLATGGIDLMVFRLKSDGNLSLIQTVPAGGNTSLLASNPPVLVASNSGNFIYVINPLATGINAYTMSAGGNLTAVAGSPFLVPQNVLYTAQLSSLMADPGGKRLYALDVSGSIVEAPIDPSTGALTFGSASASAGFLPQSATLDPTGKSIYVSELVAGFTPTGDYAGLVGFTSDSASGSVTLMPASPFQLASNSQPCGVAMDPAGRFVYTALVNADAVAGFTRDATSGALTQIAGSPFPTSHSPSQTCDVVVHPSGKFLYALNLNGHDISGYSINSGTGALTPLTGSPFPPQSSPTDPSHSPFTQGPIAMDPSGNFLFVLTGESYIAVYKINPTTGALSISGSPRSIPEPFFSVGIVKTN